MTRASTEEQQQPIGGERIKRSMVGDAEEEEEEEEEEADEDGEHGNEAINVSSGGQVSSKGEQPYVEQQQPGSNDSGASNKPKRNPFCSRCRNHGKSAQVKGHKRHCEYRDCQCEGCKLVECRQIVSAAQIKRRRYQKQDEECGRRIEISPPVLKREPSTDPAALIAKTLIGSKTQQHQHLPPSLHHVPPSIGPKHHLDLTADHHYHPHHRQLFCSMPIQQPVTTTTVTAATNSSTSHYHHQQQQPASNAAFSNTLHLFQLPNSVLSSHNHHHHNHSHHQQQANQLPASQHQHHQQQQQPQQSTSPPLLSARDQLNLVEEIFHSFGPIAIYTWLRAEHFDLQKIHNSIELVRPYYNNLVNLKLNYAHHAAAAAAAVAATAATQGADLTTSQHHGATTTMHCSSSPTSRTLALTDTVGSISNCSSGGGGVAGTGSDSVTSCSSDAGQIYHGGETPTGPTPMVLGAVATTTTSTKTSSTIMPNTSTDTNTSTTSAPNAAHLSLAATLNSLPMPTASGLLWSGLRSTATAIDRDGNAIIRPLPFLPHFMHQHHHSLFNAAASQASRQHHHPHHQNNHNQHPHQQVSPTSTVTNLSTLASSSSTVL